MARILHLDAGLRGERSISRQPLGLTAEAGWQWRGQIGHSFRTGLYYFNGKSDESEFFTNSEQLLGGGAWCDF